MNTNSIKYTQVQNFHSTGSVFTYVLTHVFSRDLKFQVRRTQPNITMRWFRITEKNLIDRIQKSYGFLKKYSRHLLSSRLCRKKVSVKKAFIRTLLMFYRHTKKSWQTNFHGKKTVFSPDVIVRNRCSRPNTSEEV